MFLSRKHKTVASVMETFKTMVTDLENIAEQNARYRVDLIAVRARLSDKIDWIDLEIHQANGTASRLNDLVFGTEPSTECNEDCPK